MAKRTSKSNAHETSGQAAETPAAAVPKARRARTSSPEQPPNDASSSGNRSDSMSSGPSDEAIRLRAYHRYLERGGGHGKESEDWIQAEKELKGRR